MTSQSTLDHKGLLGSAFGSPLFLRAAGLLVVASFIRFLLIRPKKLDLPVVETPDSNDQREALVLGTAQVRHYSVFIARSTLTHLELVPRQSVHNTIAPTTRHPPNINYK